MNKLFALIVTLSCFFNIVSSKAQEFSVAHDTVTISAAATGIGIFDDSVNNLTPYLLLWGFEVDMTDFPTDWINATKFCDPYMCFTVPDMLLPGFSHTPEIVPGNNTFYMAMDFSMLSSYGTHFVTIKMSSWSSWPGPGWNKDSALVTFIVSRPAASAIQPVYAANDIMLSPNPTNNELNITSNSASDLNAVNIYNITGSLVTRIESMATSGGIHADISNIPQGVYTVKVENKKGDILAIKQIIKQ
ncbi:MAG: T9SS type A sorting domain-containing protein [Flavipsychrobacter sp.]|nr:T9SS type A sorting domain-containing protein [Flavipsychrobacter sp.]